MDLDELSSDLNHVLTQLERLITADAGAADQSERMSALVRARQRAAATSTLGLLLLLFQVLLEPCGGEAAACSGTCLFSSSPTAY